MKAKKRLFAGMLALAMLLSLNVTAFAQEPDTYEDQSSIRVKKEYVITNKDTTAPDEDFTFNVDLVSIENGAVDVTAENAPKPTVSAAEFNGPIIATSDGQTATADIEITLPEIDGASGYKGVGVYTYKITENTANATPGITYDSTPIYLVVTVLQQGNELVRQVGIHESELDGEEYQMTNGKINPGDTAFTNTYSAGNLTISKNVTGLFGDTGKYFKFTVNVSGKTGTTYNVDISDGSGDVSVADRSNPTSITAGTDTTFWLKSDDSIVIQNLPYGVTYTVSEDSTESEGYTVKVNGEAGDKVTNAEVDVAAETVAFTNEKGGTIDTGVYLDNLPYIIVFAGVLAVAAVLVIRRRRVDD